MPNSHSYSWYLRVTRVIRLIRFFRVIRITSRETQFCVKCKPSCAEMQHITLNHIIIIMIIIIIIIIVIIIIMILIIINNNKITIIITIMIVITNIMIIMNDNVLLVKFAITRGKQTLAATALSDSFRWCAWLIA
jgi:hypothetical protein